MPFQRKTLRNVKRRPQARPRSAPTAVFAHFAHFNICAIRAVLHCAKIAPFYIAHFAQRKTATTGPTARGAHRGFAHFVRRFTLRALRAVSTPPSDPPPFDRGTRLTRAVFDPRRF